MTCGNWTKNGPGSAMVGHADRILGRDGRMVRSVEALGPGIPATEEQALRTKGAEYREYQRTTSAFVPWFPRSAA